jgi:hypothetical protein
MTDAASRPPTSKYLPNDHFSRENAKTPSTQSLHTIPESNKRPASRPSSAKPSSPSKSQPQKYFSGLTDKEKTESYFDLYDQNLALRNQKNELESQIKKLTTQLVRLTKDIKPSNNVELEIENEQLLKENNSLKAKLQLNKLTRPGTSKTQSRNPATKKAPFLTPKIIEKTPAYVEEDLKEREEIIKLLRDQLEATEAELLRAQMPKPEVPDLSSEFREKAYRLAEVENKFYSLEESLSAQRVYIEHLVKVVEESQVALKEERFKNCELEVRLRAAEMAASGARDLAFKLRDCENERNSLEIRLKETIEAYFELEANRKDNPINLPAPSVSRIPR